MADLNAGVYQHGRIYIVNENKIMGPGGTGPPTLTGPPGPPNPHGPPSIAGSAGAVVTPLVRAEWVKNLTWT